MRVRTRVLISLVTIVITGLVARRTPQSPLPAKEEMATSSLLKVVRVVDGDTIDVLASSTKERVRLIGIDTPEVVDPRKPVQCFGKEASAETHRLLDGKDVYLEKDPTQGDRDKYGRTLAYVFLPDGTNIDKLLIEEGFAHEYTYDMPYKYQAEFKTAEIEAREAKRGLWADGVCS